jgi:hypothetical protein
VTHESIDAMDDCDFLTGLSLRELCEQHERFRQERESTLAALHRMFPNRAGF